MDQAPGLGKGAMPRKALLPPSRIAADSDGLSRLSSTEDDRFPILSIPEGDSAYRTLSGQDRASGGQVLVVRQQRLTDPRAPFRALRPMEGATDHHVARNQPGDGREADGPEHLYGAAVWRREMHSHYFRVSSDDSGGDEETTEGVAHGRGGFRWWVRVAERGHRRDGRRR
jgi:hypothetical protein